MGGCGVSDHFVNNRFACQSNTVSETLASDHLLGQKSDILFRFLFPVSDHTVLSLINSYLRGSRALQGFCCAANVASEQQHNQDLRRIYRRGYEFPNSSLFTRMHCVTFCQRALRHEQHEDVTPSSRRLISRRFQ